MTPTARAMRMQPVVRAAPEAETQRAIPFDYTFRFDLEGKPERLVRSVVSVSVEASFTAVSIGYGVVPKVTPVVFGPPLPGSNDFISRGNSPINLRPMLSHIVFDSLFTSLNTALKNTPGVASGDAAVEAAFKSGIRLNPEFADLALLRPGGTRMLTEDVLRNLFQVVSAPGDEVQFLYALFDDGTGREFQSEPLLNTAGLGGSGGQRPFRYFAQPITFAPRSTIRMEVIEKSQFLGDLHVSLHGYKVLGGAGTPTGRDRSRGMRGRRRA